MATVEDIREILRQTLSENYRPKSYEDMYFVCVNCGEFHKGFPHDWIVLCDKCREELNWGK